MSGSTAKALSEALRERILVLDGAMGTAVQTLDLDADAFGGQDLDGCNEHLVLTQPDAIRSIHLGYLRAGADILETDTFGGTRVVLAEYDLQDKVHDINAAAARLAREAIEELADDRPRFVAGSMGPGTKSISVTENITFAEVRAAYAEQASALVAGGVDLLFLETQQDTLNVKASLLGIEDAFAGGSRQVPVVLSVSIENWGTMLGGQSIESVYTSVAHRDLAAIGMNCATGPDFMTDHLRTLAEISRFPIVCFPNAGLPDEDGNYNELPDALAAKVERFCSEGWLNVIGGCCGTTAEHIAKIAAIAGRHRPRAGGSRSTVPVVSGLETLLIDEDTRPVIVGERTNVLGSRKFKRLIREGKIDEAAEIGRKQVRSGAHVLDVCVQDPDRDEITDMRVFLESQVKKVKVPIMIDTTDPVVIEEALQRTQGKSLINSINLEDGEERFESVVPLARRYGAALVVGCIDEDKQQAQAITRERKLAIAQRSFDLLTKNYGVAPGDIIFDALVFPIGTGDEAYVGSGVETIEGIRLIKEALPEARTILGVSNVSFGLPAAGREVLNSVFLYHCVQAGLDMAIVSSEKLERYPSIPEEERRLAEDLIWWRGDDPIAAFSDHFRDRAPKKTVEERRNLPLDERLALYVLEGTKDGLAADLDEALAERAPLEIINGPLMDGMSEVGRLFGANEMIVAEVLQSAEAMKAAVSHLEPHMEKSESAVKGKILLATVKGDVHDIGKNLVDIILSNNGYQVVNLGIKVPPEDLLRAHREHEPDIIGLSGLLVKSAQMMVATAQDLRRSSVDCPILVGGAALSNRFTRLRIAPEYEGLVAYASDAMNGLDLANRVVDADLRRELADKLSSDGERLARERAAAEAAPKAKPVAAAEVRRDHDIPQPPDLKAHRLDDYDLDEIFTYVNPVMLYTRHLGFKGRFAEALGAGDAKAVDLQRHVSGVQEEILSRDDIQARAVYKFFKAGADGQAVQLLSADGTRVLEEFHFGRQTVGDGLCLSDYVLPRDDRRDDFVCLFATTIGPGVRELAERWKNDGDYLRSHILQALALESAEAFAELLHAKIRAMWGFADPAGTSMQDLFKARYRGVRVSFGYPACPRLEDQAQLFRALDVTEAIGVELTDGFMMDPEGSVSAVVFHHPDARYFSLTPGDAAALEDQGAAEQRA